MKIAAAYIRVSTDDQIEYSPDSQLAKIREYAKKNDYILPDEYIFMDEGISGKTTAKRPEFNRMIGTAKQKNKPFDAILLWKFSRFARNREDSIVYKSMLRKQLGIDVISISENLGDDKMSILIEALIEAMDEYYSINLAEEVKRGMLEKVKRGEPVVAPPYGYKMENKAYIPDPDAVPVVQLIFQKFAAGIGYRTIADEINTMGYRTQHGNPWENRTIKYLLENPVYLGNIIYNPTQRIQVDRNHPDIIVTKGSHTPLISKDLWDLAQAKIVENAKAYGKYSRRGDGKTTFALRGLVKCSNCGATLSRATTNSLQCHQYAKGKCSVSHSIMIPKITQSVYSSIEDTLSSGEFTLIKKDSFEIVDRKKTLQASLKREQIKLDRVRDAYENGIDTLREYKSRKNEVMAAIARIEKELSKKDDIKETRKAFAEKNLKLMVVIRAEETPEEEKNRLLRTFVDHITFFRSTEAVDIVFYN